MASKPHIDKRSGVWYCKSKLDRDAEWEPIEFGKHDTQFSPRRPPKTWLKQVEERQADVKGRS